MERISIASMLSLKDDLLRCMLELLIWPASAHAPASNAASAVNPAVPKQEGKQLLAFAPKIVRRRLAARHKIAHRLMSRVRRPYPRQFAGSMQPRQRDRVAPVRLDPARPPVSGSGQARPPCNRGRGPVPGDKARIPSAQLQSRHAALVAIRQSLDRPLDRQRLFSTSPRNRTSPLRPPSATATACFFLATSKATKTSLYFPMVRPPCMRLARPAPSNPRSYLHERAGHRRWSANMTSSANLNRRAPVQEPAVCVRYLRNADTFKSNATYGAVGYRLKLRSLAIG